MKRITLLALGLGLCLAAEAADPITLGLNYPRTGSDREEGLSQMHGALLAIDEINAKGRRAGPSASTFSPQLGVAARESRGQRLQAGR